MSDAIRARRDPPRCSACVVRHLCVPEGLSARDIGKFEQVISAAHLVRRGEALFRAGDAFNALFAVRSGSLKTVAIRDGGRKQVTGLMLAADPLGLDGIGDGQHTYDAIALEDSSVCVIPYSLFERICREMETLQKRVLRMLGQAINRESDHALRLAMLRADERVARLLLDLSARLAKRGYAADEFTLRMTRDDIGSYLGLTLETVSRTLSRFDKIGLIDAKGKAVRIRDFERLRSIGAG
ncbi:helix-turn-helix domain-containing protein [Caballeronia sp. HLA56]